MKKLSEWVSTENYLPKEKVQESKSYTWTWNKLFTRLAIEMHELFPDLALEECLRLIHARHEQNKAENKRLV